VTAAALCAGLVASGCARPEAIDGTSLGFDFASDGFYDAPFPSDHRLKAEGGVAITDFPNPDKIDFVTSMRRLVSTEARGFGVSSGIFFSVSATIDSAMLPDAATSLTAEATAFLVGVGGGPDKGRRYPVDVTFDPDPGPFSPTHLLAMVPFQGVPLRPSTRYAAVVLRSAAQLGVQSDLREVIEGFVPEGMDEATYEIYRDAIETLEAQGVAVDEIAGLAVFTTDDPERGLSAALASAETPSLDAGLRHIETYDDYCVFESRMQMPVYQQGDPPFDDEGGNWALDADGQPVLQGHETARLFVTVPRRAAPAGGFPTVVFIRTGGGGDRPLIDRGVRASAGADAVAGTGPAQEFARVGFAGVMVDGPHGGIRNVSGGDEQLLIFNFFNPPAMRDNVRQSALELALLPRVLEGLTITSTACPSVGDTATLDTERLVLMGHSMGATIGPLSLAVEGRYRAMILSGAGGSWMENIIRKRSPLVVRPLAELILSYEPVGRTLRRTDPVLSMLQWAGEPADPPIYGRRIISEPTVGTPRHVLMLQGIVDTYILPEIANATTLSFGLDLAGEALDPNIEATLPLAAARRVELPATANIDGKVTAVVVQHAEDGIEDGHEVAFQLEAPKRQYRGFLESFASSAAPTVPR